MNILYMTTFTSILFEADDVPCGYFETHINLLGVQEWYQYGIFLRT